jgi:subtilisin family serine protease
MADDTRVTHARRGIARALSFTCLLSFAIVPSASADVRLIVKHGPDLTRAERGDIRRDAGVSFAGALAVPGAEVVTVAAPQRAAALRALNADPNVQYAEPAVTFHALTNDEYFDDQWALKNTGQRFGHPGGEPGADMAVPAAWAYSRGAGQTVAVVDTGVDAQHADLQGRVAPGGRSYVTGVATSDDDYGHGTAVAGAIAANADNLEGIAGVAPQATVLPLKALDRTGSGGSVAVGDALDYAGALGLRIVNASIGSSDYSQYVHDAIARHPNTLYVVPAGNDGADNDAAVGGDPQYPCDFPEANVLCVGASDNQDNVWLESNFGAVSVDLFAPGSYVLSTFIGPDYAFQNGTSIATAMVSGEAALVLGAHPDLTAASVKWIVLASARPIAGAVSVTGGRADALAAVTTPLVDRDGDGALDAVDDCPAAADPAQADSDGDGIGDACDPLPRGADQDGDGRGVLDDRCPTVAAPTPDGCPAPTVTPLVVTPAALKLLALTVKLQPAKCPRGKPCVRSARITVRLSRTATVALRVERKVRSRWTRVYTRSLSVTSAGRTVTVKGRGGRTLPKGSYRVSATPAGVKSTTHAFRVP